MVARTGDAVEVEERMNSSSCRHRETRLRRISKQTLSAGSRLAAG